MASVTSLDKDLRRLRLEKYTSAAANEAREWIEFILGDKLPSSDLLEGLKDGVALCRLVNLALPPPGVRFKTSTMPFVQMENISHFLRVCLQPPFNLQQHDMFLTVDLYEQKDPAQVLQCIGAFSRAAHQANPCAFPHPIGPKSRGSLVSPQSTGPPPPATPVRTKNGPNQRVDQPQRPGSSSALGGFFSTRTPLVPHKTADSDARSNRESPTRNQTKSPGSPGVATSSWSKREHEQSTVPAWNIAQYGYLGGASQGNLGIAFGGRRQITGPSPQVPSLAEKEKRRREKEAEEEHLRLREEHEKWQREKEEEENARLEEERRWEEETHRLQAEERQRADEEKRRWEEEERQWKITEEKRRREDEEAEARLEQERARARSRSRPRLEGQYLSQYQAERDIAQPQQQQQQQQQQHDEEDLAARVHELEKELELAREREREYERGRGRTDRGTSQLLDPDSARSRARSRSRTSHLSSPVSRQDSWRKNDEEVLTTPRVSPAPRGKSPRPLPDPPATITAHHTGGASRPLPDPRTAAAAAAAAAASPHMHNSSTFMPMSPIPPPHAFGALPAPSLPPRSADNSPFARRSEPLQPQSPPQPTYSRELDPTMERDAEDRRRAQNQVQTRAGGLASKSLLEREMEMERQRQREWEEEQAKTAARVPDGAMHGIDGRWDVSQWSGYTGGDGQNRGSQGIGVNRRQMGGARPLPGPPM